MGNQLIEPPLTGRWHHGNGVLVCGTVRVARADFDTNPSAAFEDEMLGWMCRVMNAETGLYLAKKRGQPDAAIVYEEVEPGVEVRLSAELEAELRRAINPTYADMKGTESYERKRLLGEIDALRAERDKIAQELLTPGVFSRLVDWLRNPKPAATAFTSGIERQIAYALEMDVLPEVRSLHIRLKNCQENQGK